MKREKIATWFFTIAGFMIAVLTALREVWKTYGNDPEFSRICDSIMESFTTYGIMYSNVIWIIFLTFYGVLHYYEYVHKRYPERSEKNLVEENYYLTLWAWGIAASIVQYASIATGATIEIHIIGNHPVLVKIISISIGCWGMYMLINGRVNIDGYWTNHIYKYENHKVVDTGLYSKVRHPIYGGQFYITLSIFVAYNNYYIIFLPAMTAIYNIRRAKKEENALIIITNNKYDEYIKRCPNFMFHPFG